MRFSAVITALLIGAMGYMSAFANPQAFDEHQIICMVLTVCTLGECL